MRGNLSTTGRRRLSMLTAAVLLCTVVGVPAGAVPILDEALRTVTCTGLVDGLADDIQEVAEHLVDPSSCHTASSAAVCPTPGETCTTEVEQSDEVGTVAVNVTGVADPGGFMALTIGRTAASQACGQPLYVDATMRFESQGVRDLEASHRVTKSLDQVTPQNGAGNLGICYQAPKPFTDRDGNATLSGLLPDCDIEAPQPPCISKRHKNKADAIVKMLLPPGDPSWQMVLDTLDKATG